MAKTPKHSTVMHCIRERLAGTRAAAGHWYDADRAEIATRFKASWLQDTTYGLVYWVFPDHEREVEQTTGGRITFEAEVSILGMRRYPTANEDPWRPPVEVATAAFANGALAIAAQPTEPGQLLVTLADDDASATAGTLTMTGADQLGAPVVEVFDLADAGRWYRTAGTFASLSSLVVAGVAGASSDDVVRVRAGVSRWQVQNRIVRDVIRRVIAAGQLAACVDGIVNVQLLTVDRKMKLAGWVPVRLDLTVTYETTRGA